jgi:hypothetical protein
MRRGAHWHVVIDDAGVAEFQAVFVELVDGWYVADLAPKRKSRSNRGPGGEARKVRDGERIRLGGIKVRLRITRSEAGHTGLVAGAGSVTPVDPEESARGVAAEVWDQTVPAPAGSGVSARGPPGGTALSSGGPIDEPDAAVVASAAHRIRGLITALTRWVSTHRWTVRIATVALVAATLLLVPATAAAAPAAAEVAQGVGSSHTGAGPLLVVAGAVAAVVLWVAERRPSRWAGCCPRWGCWWWAV